jgi:hypothetical protein
VSNQPQNWLQAGAYWVNDGEWGAGTLTRGTYTGLAGTQFEQQIGVSKDVGALGQIAWRMSWKWPIGSTEVKSYPGAIVGAKPGCQNSWTVPCGHPILLPDGTQSQVFPSGTTPGTFLPLQMPVKSLKSSFAYAHNSAPAGRGHLSYDIWLQNTPVQQHGFNAIGEITHEIMIPLDYWGGYGQHGVDRNPGWYDHDVTIDGILFHVYVAKGGDGALRPDFGGGWKFIVFEPDAPIKARTLDLAKFINHVTTRKDSYGTPWAVGNEHVVSVELGVEPVEGTGDMTVWNYRVWQ